MKQKYEYESRLSLFRNDHLRDIMSAIVIKLQLSKSGTVQATSVLLVFGLLSSLGLDNGTNVGVVLVVVVLDLGLGGGFAAFGGLLNRLLIAVIVVFGGALLASLGGRSLGGAVGVGAATVSIVR